MALVLFMSAGGVPVLLLARVAQGVATGAAITTLAATLVDLNPAARTGPRRGRQWRRAHHRPRSGALGCGALVQFAPAPTHLIYALLLGGMGLASVVVGGMPETSARRPGLLASLTPRLSVPARLRRDVYALVPIFVAGWALAGLYLSLGPSIAVSLFGLSNHLIGGLVVTLLCRSGAVTTWDCAPPRWSTALVWSPSASPRSLANACVR